MNTIVIDNNTYTFPTRIEAQYDDLYLDRIITGAEQFDEIEEFGIDFLDSELFAVFAEAKGIEEGDADIAQVRNSVFAYYSNEEDFDIILLEKI